MVKKANLAVNYQGIPSDNANLPKNLPEKLSACSVDRFPEEHQDKEKLTFTDFLGVCPSSNPCGLIDLNSTPLSSSSSAHLRGRVNMQHRDLSSCSSDGNPSFFMQRQIAEISIADLTSRGRHGYLSEMPKRYSNHWSEEELDFLWIGVRRHGTSNWNAVLRDPKLHFVESRTPEDLSLQWEHEQKKVLNDIFSPAMHSKPSFFSSSFLDGHPENPMHAAETKLSLGDVYFPKENIPSTGRFHPLGFAFPSTNESSSSCVLPGSYLSVSKYPRLSTRQQMLTAASTTMYHTENGCYKRFSEGSAQEQQQQAGTHLPHWLKDVSSSHPSRRELSLWPHFASGIDASCSNNETALCLPGSNATELLATSKDLRRRGILKRKSAVLGIASGSVRIREPSPSVAESASGIRPGVVLSQSQTSERPALCLGASHAADLSFNASTPIMASELVVIDSDLSSEETISDDQSSRP
ncbi:hypothetical protein HPP92_006807 [Vanilla planifolia]|uniref:Myb-like domain-containing protein n=1 Tax=Vanilla planifolia TaxID=51239 RepID=A0A835RJ40_VANPL|nr:hypothetical protein HPP92_006807 [Vanilla planifolia]